MEKKNILHLCVSIALALMVVGACVCGISALKVATTTRNEMLNLSLRVSEYETKVSTKLDSIVDDVDFLRSWCASAPSVTLGDTYINNSGKNTTNTETDNSKQLVKKGK